MQDVLLHPQTKAAIERFQQSGNHAVVLAGSVGSGLGTLARKLAAMLLSTDKLDNSPYYSFIEPDGKAITIEQIRSLQTNLTLRTTGTRAIRRVIILHKADKMTAEAQNALLKSLEEPPLDTVLILTSYQAQALAPTIRSRVQSIVVRRIRFDEAVTFFSGSYTGAQVKKAYALSDGQAGLIVALLENEHDHELAAAIAYAKSLYGKTVYERLLLVDIASKDKDQLPQLLFACKRICIGALEASAAKQQPSVTANWTRKLSVILEAEEQLPSNPNPKLFLTNLFMQM